MPGRYSTVVYPTHGTPIHTGHDFQMQTTKRYELFTLSAVRGVAWRRPAQRNASARRTRTDGHVKTENYTQHIHVDDVMRCDMLAPGV